MESETHQGHSESQAWRRAGDVGGGASLRSQEPDVGHPGGPGTLLPERLWAPGAVGKPWAGGGLCLQVHASAPPCLQAAQPLASVRRCFPERGRGSSVCLCLPGAVRVDGQRGRAGGQ